MSAAIIAVAAACGPAPAPAVDNSTTVTTAPTTRTPRIVDDSGRPDITFDPCLDLPDDVMTAAGYDAAHKEFADMPMGSYTFLACYYRGTVQIPGVLARYDLNVMAGNVSLDEELKKNGQFATEITINGRPALREIGTNGDNECTYVLETNFGIVLFNRLYHKDHTGPVPLDEWCAGLDDFVTAVEPLLKA
ncbi:DUF3558 domain-containing protein [Rhodococcus sp. F64268]|uniref:DUF3558 domain-containing protein n=2 Tax=unclassified Rhodococcus (in: high G+C Gram-positive bacteria) TaxID=192944 RepID=UPI001FF5ADFA|nr:DUF3558 domain-containing protein [Rhodococcus sp. F64268]MCK0093912.1 DUF3558 domain-containing protein [Rhodococcus sp. F64268]